MPPFFVPSYLRGSKHAEKLQKAHTARLAATQRECRPAQSSVAGSLSTSSSSVNLHKMAGSHRGLTHEVMERAPVFVDEPVSPWPTRWNDNDKFAQLDIEDEGTQAKYSGSQKTHDEAASVRADCPMPRQCGIYYYEVTVVSKGKDGYAASTNLGTYTDAHDRRMIGVGFSGPNVALSRIPGWEPDSFAYHGDDGQIFNNTTSGKNYGPKFGTLDVIGCGINFRTNAAFFTKNGHMLGMSNVTSTALLHADPLRHCFPRFEAQHVVLPHYRNEEARRDTSCEFRPGAFRVRHCQDDARRKDCHTRGRSSDDFRTERYISARRDTVHSSTDRSVFGSRWLR